MVFIKIIFLKDISVDVIPNNENGVNTRNGFPKLTRIIPPSDKLLIKPNAINI
jgi:hypothetical protein